MRLNSSFKSLIALAAAGAWAGSAYAQAVDTQSAGLQAVNAQSVNKRFAKLDRNHDGFLSREEAKNAPELDTRFSELDVNNDGKLSRAEYRVVAAGENAMLPGAATAASGATHP